MFICPIRTSVLGVDDIPCCWLWCWGYYDVTVQEELRGLKTIPETPAVFRGAKDWHQRVFWTAKARCTQHTGEAEEAVAFKFHYIIHQKNCAGMPNSDPNNVMARVARIVNFIVKPCSFPPCWRRWTAHSTVTWLKCRKVLERSVGCFDTIKSIRNSRTDITGHLNKQHSGAPALQQAHFFICSSTLSVQRKISHK